MQYGRSDNSERWHQLVRGKARCYPSLTITETKKSEDVTPDDRCQNCDGHLRGPGIRTRRKLRRQRQQAKTDYQPRFKFDDEIA